MITFLAVARVGAVAVLANPEITAADHAFMAGDCDAALCVTDARLEGRFDRRRWLDVERLLASAGGATRAGVQPVGARTPLYIQYTSGTTGEPKGVVHHHGDLPVYHDAIGGPVLAVQRADVTLSVSKLFFAYGFGNAFVFPLYSGSSAVLVGERPSAETVAELVARHRVTLLYAVPSAYAALVDRARPDAFDSVRAAVSAGETLPPALGTRAAALLGAPVCEQIGSTEVGHAFCANTVHHNVPGTLGRPVPGYDIELRDPDGNPVGDETPGELWVAGRPCCARPAMPGWRPSRRWRRRRTSGTGSRCTTARTAPTGTTTSICRAAALGAEDRPALRPLHLRAQPVLSTASTRRAGSCPISTRSR